MTDKSLDEFLTDLDRYGGRISDWPSEAGSRAEALLERSADARSHLAAMRRVEAALSIPPSLSGPAIDVVVMRAMQSAQLHMRGTTIRRASWLMVGTLALIAGLYVGTLSGPGDSPSDVVAAALGQTEAHDVW